MLALLEQAEENVGPKSTFRFLVIDRGFLEGKVRFAINQRGIELVIPVKSNMTATTDARQLAMEAFGSYQACREVEVTHGYAKKNHTEKILTELIGVPGLLTCDSFNPEGSEANTTKKDFEPIPLNAVVIKTWDDKKPPIDKQVVLVTNGDVSNPFVAFDRYDDLGLIENNLFRDTRQNWCLEHPPRNTKESILVQVHVVMALKGAFHRLPHVAGRTSAPPPAGEQTTWNMYRHELKALNRNKLIAFVGQCFGIFSSHKVFMLAGVTVHDAEKELKISRTKIHT